MFLCTIQMTICHIYSLYNYYAFVDGSANCRAVNTCLGSFSRKVSSLYDAILLVKKGKGIRGKHPKAR